MKKGALMGGSFPFSLISAREKQKNEKRGSKQQEQAFEFSIGEKPGGIKWSISQHESACKGRFRSIGNLMSCKIRGKKFPSNMDEKFGQKSF